MIFGHLVGQAVYLSLPSTYVLLIIKEQNDVSNYSAPQIPFSVLSVNCCHFREKDSAVAFCC